MIELHRSINSLADKEKVIVSMFYGIGYNDRFTLSEIGEELTLTRERVRQIKEKAIRKMRHESRSKYIKEFL